MKGPFFGYFSNQFENPVLDSLNLKKYEVHFYNNLLHIKKLLWTVLWLPIFN